MENTEINPQASDPANAPVAPSAPPAPANGAIQATATARISPSGSPDVSVTLVVPEAKAAPAPAPPAAPAPPKEPVPDAAKPAPPHSHRLLIILLSAGALLAGIAFGVYYHFGIAPYESTDDAYIDGHIISVSPQVSALVAAIHIDDNLYVHKGDLLVELDPTDYQVALSQARGAEASTEGKLEQARAGVDTAVSAVAEARAEVVSALATFENANLDWKKYQGLEPAARSQEVADTVTAKQKTAAAAVEQAKASVQSAQSQVTAAKANVIAADGDYRKAQADTKRAEVNLGYCRIIAPTDGRITSKAVDPGDYVTALNPLFEIVPANVWVTANFKETQLNNMQPGQPVTLTVDAYSKMTLHGTVNSIQAGTGSRFSIIPAENATGNFVKIVQRVPVKITLDGDPNADSNRLLSPGMSVTPKVRVH
jgi:membrane fusion protein (multidrug efflux system)